VRQKRSQKIVIALFLVFGIGLNGAMAEACFCGQACLHGLQNNSKKQVTPLFHNRCDGTNCQGCNVEEGQTLKTVALDKTTVNAKFFHAPHILSVLADYPLTNHVFDGFGSLFTRATIPCSPLYQKNIPLLC
jgi:hypothetical protein